MQKTEKWDYRCHFSPPNYSLKFAFLLLLACYYQYKSHMESSPEVGCRAAGRRLGNTRLTCCAQS